MGEMALGSNNREMALGLTDNREHRRNVARERILMARQKQRLMKLSKRASKLEERAVEDAGHDAKQKGVKDGKEGEGRAQKTQHVHNVLSTSELEQACICDDDPDQLTFSKKLIKEETLDDKLKRLVCLENFPSDLTEEDLVAELAKNGAIESVCLEFKPFTVVGAIASENVKTPLLFDVNYRRNLYVVYEKRESARYACSHVLKESGGKYAWVDKVLPSKINAEDSSIERAFAHTLCIGNLPFDVEGEEILKLFCHSAHAAIEVEAIRLIRDLQTSAGNGFSFVLFKSKIASKHALKQGPLRIRGKMLKMQYLYRPSFGSKTSNQTLWSMLLKSSLESNLPDPECDKTKLILSDPLKGGLQTCATTFVDLGAACDTSNVGIVVDYLCQAKNSETCKTTENEVGEKGKKAVSEKSKKKGSSRKMSKRKRGAIDKANTLNLQKARKAKEQRKTS